MDTTQPHATPAADASTLDGVADPKSHRDDVFFSAFATTAMPMVVTDPHVADNPIVFVNEAFVAMSGYSAAEIVGRNCRFLQGPDTDGAAVVAIRDAVAARVSVATEILNYRKDGTPFWNALFISPVHDRDGRLIYFFASQLDVSRRRHAEEALGQAQKMEALGQLTGGISHDFNNLLQVMLGHIDLLDRRLHAASIDTKAIASASHGIRSAIDKASTLTRQLLAFARKQRLEHRVANLNDLTDRVMTLVTRTLGGSIEVVTDLAPDLDDCRIDATQFELSLLNVLINARDAMTAGGRVRIRTFNATIGPDDLRSFEDLAAGRYVVIAVTDDGPGIPPEIVHRVMEPFFTTKDEGKGTGLGLSMVYGFAKQSGGGVHLESEIGRGTTVQLYFPSGSGDAGRVAARGALSRERGGHERILLVDDRPELRQVAQDLLEELGYSVVAAGSGADALALVGSLADDALPVLLFSDVIMPGGMNGYTLARRMRQAVPRIRVLLTTGYAGDPRSDARRSDSEFEVIDKPYKLDDLARRVRQMLDGPVDA